MRFAKWRFLGCWLLTLEGFRSLVVHMVWKIEAIDIDLTKLSQTVLFIRPLKQRPHKLVVHANIKNVSYVAILPGV